MKELKELTLQEKIEFCELYLQNEELREHNCFICNRINNFLKTGHILDKAINPYNEQKLKIVFPELYEIIIKVGKQLDESFRYRSAWKIKKCDNYILFRKEKIQELLDSLKE